MLIACSSRSGDGSHASGSGGSNSPPPQAPVSDADAGSLGALSFALSEGTPEARAHFMRGLLALHSFWYDEATREFQAAVTADASMNMAYWGLAMSHCKLLWGEDDVNAAKQTLARMPNPDRLSPREQAWVMAAVELLRAPDVRSSRQRFATAMEALHAQFPDDESATFLAIALLSTIRPDDPDPIAVRKRAAALANAVYERNPKHPGAAHYVIHAYEVSELATLALPHARHYAEIAPAAFHAQHMPSHIFSRLGMWKEAIASCQAAWEASLAAARRHNMSPNAHDFHSLNWLVEMNFELGHRTDADAALKLYADAVRAGLDRRNRAQYATQVGSYMMRTGEWSRVDELLAPLEAPAVDDPTGAQPVPGTTRTGQPGSHCAPAPSTSPLALLEQHAVLDARARAAAMQRDLANTKKYVGELDAATRKLRALMAPAQPKDVAERQTKADARRDKLLFARARGDDRSLLKLLRDSAAETQVEIGEANPSGFSAHEDLAEVLMRLDKPKEALAEYAVALQKIPGRARSLLGAARAAKRTGDEAAARKFYQQLLDQWSSADANTDGLAEARTAVGK